MCSQSFCFLFFLMVEHEQSGNELRVDAGQSSECVLYQRVLRGLNFLQLQSYSQVMVILSCALNPKYPLKTLVLGTWLIFDRLWGIGQILRSLQWSLDSKSGFLGTCPRNVYLVLWPLSLSLTIMKKQPSLPHLPTIMTFCCRPRAMESLTVP